MWLCFVFDVGSIYLWFCFVLRYDVYIVVVLFMVLFCRWFCFVFGVVLYPILLCICIWFYSIYGFVIYLALFYNCPVSVPCSLLYLVLICV